jgi:hypothetical protein
MIDALGKTSLAKTETPGIEIPTITDTGKNLSASDEVSAM